MDRVSSQDRNRNTLFCITLGEHKFLEEFQMKRAAVFLFIMAGAFAAFADTDPTAVVTLDSNSPTPFFSDWDWTYTLTVSNGDLSDIQSFEIFDVGGVVDALAPFGSGWEANVTPLGGGLSDVTFSNDSDPCRDCSLDGFSILSTYNSSAMATYDVTFSDFNHIDPVVGAPAAAPEPASVGLFGGMAFLAFAGLKTRKRGSK
jgi:hypothetical protein